MLSWAPGLISKSRKSLSQVGDLRLASKSLICICEGRSPTCQYEFFSDIFS